MKAKLESYARDQMRKLRVPITWVEQAHGGTQGGPDLYIHANETIPAELKRWDYNAKGTHWLTLLRREQVRYHFVMAKAKRKTLLVWCAPNNTALWAMGGQYAPTEVRSLLWRGSSLIVEYQAAALAQLLDDINGNRFWSKM